MSITLHVAAEQVRELLDQIDSETGELPEGYESARALVATKGVAVVAYILESERQAKAVKEYTKELAARINAADRRADFLRGYLEAHMAASGVTEIKDERGIFSAKLQLERDKSVEIFDEDLVPGDYLREVPAKYEPDKDLIKRAIDNGVEVPGARIVKKNRLIIK
jgi:hypothetical protein